MLITESAGSNRPLTSGEMLARSEAVVSAGFRGNMEQRTAVLDLVGVYYRTMGDEKRALRLLQEAFETIASSPDGDLRRKVICDLGLTLGNLGNITDARQMLERVIADPQASTQQVAECLTYRSAVAQAEGDAPAAIRYAHEGLQRLQSSANPSVATEGAILGAIADAERFGGHIAAAEDYFHQSLLQFARSGREYGPDATVIRNNLALTYDATGNPKRALQVFNEILDSAARNQSGALPVTMVAHRARMLELIGRFDEAKTGYDHCIELSVKGDQPIMRVLCLAGMAWLMRERGDLRAAEHYLHEATDLARTATPAEGPHQIALKIVRGRIALANNQLGAARASLDAALAEGNTVFFQMTALVPRAELNLKQGSCSKQRRMRARLYRWPRTPREVYRAPIGPGSPGWCWAGCWRRRVTVWEARRRCSRPSTTCPTR